MGDIYLSELFTKLAPLSSYKIHFAKRSDGSEPLDAFMRDMNEWKDWNRYSINKDWYNRDYIFSLISFYPERNTWLFGGIWKVIDRDFSKKSDYPYLVELCEDYNKYIGRLKIIYAHNDRTVRNLMEIYFPNLIVKELLDDIYSTYSFPGYKNLDLPFKTLENVIRKDSPAWKSALSIYGIYLITDIKTGKRYVGSASGENGIWKRWSDYVYNGHGDDVDLHKLVEERGFEYVRENYKFTLLEITNTWNENEILDRESYWKRALLSRMADLGHNKN
ncbi:MAG: GIY-YIG nuclease family protein [Desulfotomaculaceae bacterium]|nr:GIY-YIG nuclease family protein [Desulfotomaculaceae bacterium]